MPDTLINGQLLAEAHDKLQLALSKKRLKAETRIVIEVMDLIVIFIAEDHPKTKAMYLTYRPMIWMLVVAGGAFITYLATGRVQIVFAK